MIAAGLPNRGKTWHGPNKTISTTYGPEVTAEGTEKEFDDDPPKTAAGIQVPRTGRKVKCLLVRNTSGITLTPGRLVSWESGQRFKRVDGYTRTNAAAAAGVVDPHLSSSGVRDDDLFWLVVAGPTLIKTPLEANANNVFSEGDVLYALTAATSGATTAGRPLAFDAATTGTTNVLQQILNKIGVAMSAATTANTNSDLLVNLELMHQ